MSEFNRTHIVFSIYDTKAENYSQPFIQTTTGLGLRFLEQLANDKQTVVSRYPEDHILFRLGEWDQRTGSIVMDKAPTSIAKALEYAKKDE